MSGNYSNVKGVQLSVWNGDDTEPEIDVDGGKIEEMYHDESTGHVVVRAEIDGKTYDLSIPAFAQRDDWGGFVNSLPVMD